MKLKSFGILTIKALIVLLLVSCSGTGTKSISIFETTDIHGVILPYDYIEKEKLKSGTLLNISKPDINVSTK